MTKLGKITALSAIAAAMTLTATAASARIVCNAEGDCWHVRNRGYVFQPAFGLTVHPDNWRWRHGEHFRWREHGGRGYWRSGAWVRF